MNIQSAITIAPYKVQTENQETFFLIVKEKRKYFLKAGYVTSRSPILMRSRIDKTILLEIFEWTSEKHCEDAHHDDKVQSYWNRMYKLWEDGGFGLEQIQEAKLKFAHFDPIDIY